MYSASPPAMFPPYSGALPTLAPMLPMLPTLAPAGTALSGASAAPAVAASVGGACLVGMMVVGCLRPRKSRRWYLSSAIQGEL